MHCKVAGNLALMIAEFFHSLGYLFHQFPMILQ